MQESNSKKTSSTKKSNVKSFISLLLVAVIIITGVFAFLTAQDSKKNTFTVGKVDITLKENFAGTLYDDTKTKEPVIENITPTQEIQKQPWVENDGKNEAYTYMLVGIPTIETVLADDDCCLLNDGKVTKTPAFHLVNSEGEKDAVNDGWSLVKTYTNRIDEDGNPCTYYLYGYNGAVPAKTANEEDESYKTAPLFDSVEVVNFVANNDDVLTDKDGNEYSIPEELAIPIKAFAIQTNIPDVTVTDSTSLTGTELAGIWDILSNTDEFEEPQEPVCATFAGYYEGENFVDTPASFTFSELKAGKDADKYGYNKDAITDTAIGAEAFKDTALTSIAIPDGVTTIGDRAFEGCEQLTSVDMPASVTNIGEDIYKDSGMESQGSVTFLGYWDEDWEFVSDPATLSWADIMAEKDADKYKYGSKSPVKELLESDIAEYTESLESYRARYNDGETWLESEIQEYEGYIEQNEYLLSQMGSVTKTTIPTAAFYDCYIESVEIPEGVKTISVYAFVGEESFFKTITLPSTLETIGEQAFAGVHCELEIPDSVKEIGDYAFGEVPIIYCSDKILALNSDYEEDDENYLWGARCANGYVDENGIVYTGEDKAEVAYYIGDSNVVVLPNTVTTIKTHALRDIRNSEITLPSSVKSIGTYAFNWEVSKLTYNGNEYNNVMQSDGEDSPCQAFINAFNSYNTGTPGFTPVDKYIFDN